MRATCDPLTKGAREGAARTWRFGCRQMGRCNMHRPDLALRLIRVREQWLGGQGGGRGGRAPVAARAAGTPR